MVQARANLAIARSTSAESKLRRMACNSSGWTLAALTRQVARSSPKPLTPCSAGIRTQLDATCIWLTFQLAVQWETTSVPRDGHQHSRKADGLLVAGRCKSLLLQHQLNSSLER